MSDIESELDGNAGYFLTDETRKAGEPLASINNIREYDPVVLAGESTKSDVAGRFVNDLDGVRKWVIDEVSGPKAYVLGLSESIPCVDEGSAEQNPLKARPRTVEVFNALAPRVQVAAQAMIDILQTGGESGLDEVKDGKGLVSHIDVSGLIGVDYPGLTEMVEPAQGKSAENRIIFQRQMALVLMYLANLILIKSGVNKGDVDLGGCKDEEGCKTTHFRKPSDLMFRSATFCVGKDNKSLLRLELGTVASTGSMLNECGEGDLQDHAYRYFTGEPDAQRPGKPQLTTWPSGEPWKPEFLKDTTARQFSGDIGFTNGND
ncbi:MAG: hypothetical protein WCT53_01060 [Candidatus Gracilibacteria bacterium]